MVSLIHAYYVFSIHTHAFYVCFAVASFAVVLIVFSTFRSGMVSLRCIGRCKIFQLGQEKKTKVRASQPLHCILFLLYYILFLPFSRTLLISNDVARRCAALHCMPCYAAPLSNVAHTSSRVSPCSKSFGNEVPQHLLLNKYSWAVVFTPHFSTDFSFIIIETAANSIKLHDLRVRISLSCVHT